jgi:hypothetical protein
MREGRLFVVQQTIGLVREELQRLVRDSPDAIIISSLEDDWQATTISSRRWSAR